MEELELEDLESEDLDFEDLKDLDLEGFGSARRDGAAACVRVAGSVTNSPMDAFNATASAASPLTNASH